MKIHFHEIATLAFNFVSFLLFNSLTRQFTARNEYLLRYSDAGRLQQIVYHERKSECHLISPGILLADK
jgi:hypothetical protein